MAESRIPGLPPVPDSDGVDLRLCGCGSGLRALRCCEIGTAALASKSAAAVLTPLFEAWRQGASLQALDADEAPLLAVLDLAPDHASALRALYARRATHGPARAADALLQRFVGHHPNDVWGRSELALRLLGKRDLAAAEVQARSAIRLAPTSAQAHEILGLVMLEQSRGHVAEHHLRRALELGERRHPQLLTRLGTALRQQSRLAESRTFYAEADAAQPAQVETLFGWARTEEATQDFARAGALYAAAARVAPTHAALRIAQAELMARTGEREAALAALDGLDRNNAEALLARGRVLDRLERPQEAFDAWTQGKALYRAQGGRTYPAAQVGRLLDRLRGFYTAARLATLPRAAPAAGQPQPIFIVGFPRSGTTLVEQMLCGHDQISGGDELPLIHALTHTAPKLLGSPLGYPEALAELWMGDGQEGLEVLRDQYLRGARHLRAADAKRPWFTDKMPLNETHLGLIALVFPDSPIIQLVRHPLDVVLSVFGNQLTHGFDCAASLDSAALHFARIADLVAFYRSELALRHMTIRYEDVVTEPAASLARMCDFIGVAFDPRCLEVAQNRRYARTASHAQVTEPIYTRSLFRWRRYRAQLAPAIAILEPTIRRLGYDLSQVPDSPTA